MPTDNLSKKASSMLKGAETNWREQVLNNLLRSVFFFGFWQW